jgi:hypothetical protein
VVEGRTPAALADELNMTPAAIRQAKSRVLRRLKLEMGELLAQAAPGVLSPPVSRAAHSCK